MRTCRCECGLPTICGEDLRDVEPHDFLYGECLRCGVIRDALKTMLDLHEAECSGCKEAEEARAALGGGK